MKLTFSFLKRVFQLRYFKPPMLPINGYTSRTQEGLHVLFLDYDGVNPEIVLQDLLLLSEDISHAFIFSTHEETDESGTVGNYHAICVDKFNFGEVIDLMRITHSDSYHKDLALKSRYRAWVLRFSEKGNRPAPKFLNFIDFGETDRETSKAHYDLITMLYPECKEQCEKHIWNFDKSTKAIVTHYNTFVEKK